LPRVGADLVIPAMALAFAGYFFWSVRDLSWEASANGLIIGSALVVLVLVQVARTALAVVRRRASLRFDGLVHPREMFAKRVGLVLITVAFIGTMHWLGVTLALFIGLYASLYLLGIRRQAVLLGISLATAAAVYALFIAALDASFPHGPVERLLALLLHRGGA
jgi:hypothetical protein